MDVCTSCDRPTSGDADHDGLPDALEYDLAHRFFPNLALQGFDYDLVVSYLYLGYSIPYTVQPYTGGLCDEDRECVEIRYGLAYTYDFGDNNPLINFFIDSGHLGDSEFYAVLLQRTAPWSVASADSSAWQLIRDFTSAHLGTATDSSRMVSYGYCPPECSVLAETSCRSHSQCHWFQGFCAGGFVHGVNCGNQPDAESCQFSGCHWLAPACSNQGEVHCYSTSPLQMHNTLYASERKHGNYHSVDECNAGALHADQCPSNAYNMWDYKSGKLQNVGSSQDHANFDTDLQAPDQCSVYRFWDDDQFGESTPYKKPFTTGLNWNLPSPSDPVSTGCGEASCVPAQGAYISHFTGAGCTGTESYYLPYDGYGYSCRSWDGGGQCGTIHRTVTNISYKYGGNCYDAWPSGNTLSNFVTVYRGGGAPAVTLSVAVAGGGQGTVTSSPAGIRCGAACSASFAPGTLVTLSAAAADGSSFSGWSGGGCSGTGSCVITLSAAQSVSAVFDLAQTPGCGEASCVPVQGMYVSHYSGPGCAGTESYYLPYDGYAYSCRTWDGTGQCGTVHHTATNYSARINGGPCQDLWPSGNTLSDFVTVYRASGCGEASCVPTQGAYISHFTGAGCTGTESYYLPYDGYGYSCRSWDGGGQCGTIHRTVTNVSYMYGGSCYDAWPAGNTLSDFVTVYR